MQQLFLRGAGDGCCSNEPDGNQDSCWEPRNYGPEFFSDSRAGTSLWWSTQTEKYSHHKPVTVPAVANWTNTVAHLKLLGWSRSHVRFWRKKQKSAHVHGAEKAKHWHLLHIWKSPFCYSFLQWWMLDLLYSRPFFLLTPGVSLWLSQVGHPAGVVISFGGGEGHVFGQVILPAILKGQISLEGSA